MGESKIVPLSIKIVGDFLIFFTLVSFIISLMLVRVESVFTFFVIIVVNLLLVVASVGFRFIKRWSVYIFTILYLGSLMFYAYTVVKGVPLELGSLMTANSIPLVVIVVTYRNWFSFK